jgi:hypothetical protein
MTAANPRRAAGSTASARAKQLPSRSLAIAAIAAIAFSAFLPRPLQADTITWTGAASSDWNEPGNWSPNQVPGPADTAIISGGPPVTVNTTASAGTLSFDWRTSLTVATGGTLNLTGSAMNYIGGPLTVATGGTLNFTGSGTISVTGVLTNNGAVNWLGGDIYLGGASGVLWNQVGGLFDIQCDQPLNDADHAFYNAGLVRKSAGAGTNLVSVILMNTGRVEVRSGTIQLSGNYTAQMSGQYLADVGTQILLASGGYSMIPSPTLTGPGFIGIAGGVATLYGAFAGHLDYTGGSITRWSALTVLSNAVLDLSGPSAKTISGQLTVAAAGVLNLTGSGMIYLYGALTNNGTVNWQAGDVFVRANAFENFYGYICNESDGLFDIQCDQALTDLGNGIFDNAGIVRKRAGTGTTLVSVQFNNTGTLELDRGWVRLTSGYAPGANSSLALSIGGPIVGTNYGQLLVDGTTSLAGTMTAWLFDGYIPATNSIFTNVIAGTLQGKFSNNIAFISPTGQPFIPVYRNNMVLLQGVTPPVLYDAAMADDGSFQFTFTNLPGAPFTVLAATNVVQPLSQWTRVLGMSEHPSGRFVFTDPDATNYPARFYRVRSP